MVLAATFQTLVAAQATLAAIAGTVRDAETGAPLAGAVVAVEALGRAAVADSAGHYELTRLPGGSYRVTARYRGYAERSLQALVPSVGLLEIDLALTVQTQQLPPIEVTALPDRPFAVGSRSSSNDRALTLADIRSDPMLAEPDAFAALQGGSVTLDPESPDGVHVRGGAADQTAYLLDGIPVLSSYHAAGVGSAWNPDVLAGVSLATPAWSTMSTDAASAAVEGQTRAPGARVGTQGSVGTGQARVAIDGPLGRSGAGFLLGFRSRMPNVAAPNDPTYLTGAAHDWLAKLELPALGGLLRLLAYDNHNSFGAAAAVTSVDSIEPSPLRNHFAWNGHSLGAEWMRVGERGTVRVRAWNATADATASWAIGTEATALDASRRDYGISASIERRSAHGVTTVGTRLVYGTSSYEATGSATPAGYVLDGSAPILAAFAQRAQRLGDALQLDIGVTGSVMQGTFYPAPRAALIWAVSNRLSLSASGSRSWQFTQSLRNAESVVGNIFPAELYVSAAAPGVPVLRSDLGVVSARYRASGDLQLTLEFFARADEGLVLVAPATGGPFADGVFAVGSGDARGVSVDLGWSRGRVSGSASYALQDVQYSYAGGSYVPGHGIAQQFEVGVAWIPSPAWSFRLGALAAANRRGTEISGGFEWEACNLVDRGCEFGGSPTSNAALGATSLPAYLRVDLGARKQWSVTIGGRPGTMALFGTVTNVFGRSNVLTFGTDPATGDRSAVEMRPRAPLVVGVDWSF